MKQRLFILGALVVLALFAFPCSAQAARVDAPQRLAVSQTYGGENFSLAVDDQGGLWGWGSNRFGTLGLNYDHSGMDREKDSVSYVEVNVPVKILDDVTWVACGYDFSAAVKRDGTLWVWGRNNYGQLGTGGLNNKGLVQGNDQYLSGYLPPHPPGYSLQYQDKPMMVMTDVAAISCASHSVAVIKTDGTLWTWGANDRHQLGHDLAGNETKYGSRYKSTPVQILEDVAAVSLGNFGGAAVKTDGTLWVWGDSYGGQFANGKLSAQSSHPIQVGEGYRDVVFDQTCFGIKTDGSLWGWGESTYGGLNGDTGLYDQGNRETRYQTVPTKLMDQVDRVYASFVPFCVVAAIQTDGSLWVWGDNTPLTPEDTAPGVMGLPRKAGSSSHIHTPTKLLDGVEQLAMYEYALAIREDGTLWSWGVSALRDIYDPSTGAIGEYLNSPFQLWETPVELPAAFLDLSPSAQAGPGPDPGMTEAVPLEITTAGVDPQDIGTAQPATQVLEIRDEHVELSGYALSDGAGGVTTYVRLRDLAWLLNGTAAQFDVGYDDHVSLTCHAPYTAHNGTEGRHPFHGDQPYIRWQGLTCVDGQDAPLQAFVLTDSHGGGHTYYKLRDLGQALGFNVGWSAQRGMYLEPGKPYNNAD